MSLHKIQDFYPDYRDHFDGQDILRFDLYSGDDKVGAVDDLLVDDDGKFRYLIINTGAWIFGKKVLLPIGRAHIDYNDRRVYVYGLTREQVEDLPEFNEDLLVDYDYEERVRGVYRPMTAAPVTPVLDVDTAALESSTSLDATPGLYGSEAYNRDTLTNPVYGQDTVTNPVYGRDNYLYDREPALYDINERNHQNLKLYQERLIAGKTRQKTGEVAIGKRVETETQTVSVPIEKEQVIIERVTPSEMGTAVAAGTDAFQEGQTIRMEVYEETPEIRKETFVREEIRVKKEVDQTTVEAKDTVRSEQLDIDRSGDINVSGAEDASNRRI